MKRFLTHENLRLGVEILLIIAVVALVFTNSHPTRAEDGGGPDNPQASYYWYQCDTPTTAHVAVFKNRIHIYCPSTTAISGAPALDTLIHWFAFPSSPDSALASRYLSIFETAVISGKNVWLQLDPTDTSGSSYGCLSSDCRQISAAELR